MCIPLSGLYCGCLPVCANDFLANVSFKRKCEVAATFISYSFFQSITSQKYCNDQQALTQTMCTCTAASICTAYFIQHPPSTTTTGRYSTAARITTTTRRISDDQQRHTTTKKFDTPRDSTDESFAPQQPGEQELRGIFIRQLSSANQLNSGVFLIFIILFLQQFLLQ